METLTDLERDCLARAIRHIIGSKDKDERDLQCRYRMLNLSKPMNCLKRHGRRWLREYGEMNISLPGLGAGFVQGGAGGVIKRR